MLQCGVIFKAILRIKDYLYGHENTYFSCCNAQLKGISSV